jgi:serine/threonine protein kinase
MSPQLIVAASASGGCSVEGAGAALAQRTPRARDKQLDDVYAFGVLLCSLLCGSQPYEDEDGEREMARTSSAIAAAAAAAPAPRGEGAGCCRQQVGWQQKDGIAALFLGVEAGLRPRLPQSVPPAITKLIRSCWEHEPACRPSFPAVARILRKVQGGL